MAGYYRHFIPNFAATFTDLMRDGNPQKMQWSDTHSKALRTLKETLCHESVLFNPDFSKEFRLHTSDVGLGTVLSQIFKRNTPYCT